MSNQTQAIVRIGHRDRSDPGSDMAAQFKRLALFFDRILFVLPDYWIVKDEFVNDPNRTIAKPGGGWHLAGIDPFRDTMPNVKVPMGNLGSELDATLRILVERGIAAEADPTAIACETDLSEFETVKSELGWTDLSDDRFLALSGSADTEFRSETATIEGLVSRKERLLHSVIPPKAVSDSVDITSILFAAQHTSSAPVFTDRAHRAELSYRYDQYKAGLSIVRGDRDTRIDYDEFLDQFGAVTFHLGNAFINSTHIDSMSTEGIVELRYEMEDSRQLFVSEHLVEATRLIEGNPWSPSVRAELERLSRGKMAADLSKFEQDGKARVKRLVEHRKGHLLDAASAAAMGATAGLAATFTASVVAGVTPWLLALIGAVGAARLPLSAIRRDVIEAKLEETEAGRSSIAYLAAIAK